MSIQFMSLASGSSGNCYYVSTREGAILIDAGIATRTIRKHLANNRLPMEHIHAVLVTHDHADHIKGLPGLGEGLHIPIYATAATHRGIAQNYCTRQKPLDTSAHTLVPGQPFKLAGFQIEAFTLPHDSHDCVGYSMKADGRHLVFMTDLGHIPDHAFPYISTADYLVLEANYDEEMLQRGPYPAYLKARIASSTGHLSNRQAATLLDQHFPSRLRHLWLCHLSRENNCPKQAEECITAILRQHLSPHEMPVMVEALQRTSPSPLYELT